MASYCIKTKPNRQTLFYVRHPLVGVNHYVNDITLLSNTELTYMSTAACFIDMLRNYDNTIKYNTCLTTSGLCKFLNLPDDKAISMETILNAAIKPDFAIMFGHNVCCYARPNTLDNKRHAIIANQCIALHIPESHDIDEQFVLSYGFNETGFMCYSYVLCKYLTIPYSNIDKFEEAWTLIS